MNQAAGELCERSGGTDTEYVAAADREGNLVSFIQSNFMGLALA
jgi:gamma-glutamyltranspeptidase